MSPRALTAVSARGLKFGHALPSEGCEKCVKRLKNTQTQSTTLPMDWSEAPPGTRDLSPHAHSDVHNHKNCTCGTSRLFLHCLDPFVPVVRNNGHGNNHVQELRCGLSSLLHKKTLCVSVSVAHRQCPSTLSMNGKGTIHCLSIGKDCWNLGCMFTGTFHQGTRSTPSRTQFTRP